MSFARDGFTYIAIAALVAAVMYAAALSRRSWALWLIAFALTIVALWVAYFFRDPRQPGARVDRTAFHEAGEPFHQPQPMRPVRLASLPELRIQ